jgi:hypothetical protein
MHVEGFMQTKEIVDAVEDVYVHLPHAPRLSA